MTKFVLCDLDGASAGYRWSRLSLLIAATDVRNGSVFENGIVFVVVVRCPFFGDALLLTWWRYHVFAKSFDRFGSLSPFYIRESRALVTVCGFRLL